MSGRMFVSYSRQDASFALKLGQDLRRAGVDLWIDQLDIPPGGRWDREVESALKRCAHLIVILSPDSVASENVMDEVSYALRERKRIFPVMYQPCDVPLRLQRLQYIDCSTNYADGLRRLVDTLTGAAEGPEGTADREPRRLRPAGSRRAWATAAVVAATLAIVIGAVWFSAERARTPEIPANVSRPMRTAVVPPPPAAPAPRVDIPPAVEGVPFFMTRRVTEADLAGKSARELNLMRNEIYARHGRRFNRADLQAYFDTQPWYRPQYDASDFPPGLLTDVQQRNVLFIQQYEQGLGRQ